MGDVENSEIPCTPWTTRMPKYAQPNLNYIGKKKNELFFLTLFFHTYKQHMHKEPSYKVFQENLMYPICSTLFTVIKKKYISRYLKVRQQMKNAQICPT